MNNAILSRQELYDASERTFFHQVFLLMGFGMVVTALTSLYISGSETLMEQLFHLESYVDDEGEPASRMSGSIWFWAAAIVQLGMVVLLTMGGMLSNISKSSGYIFFGIFAALVGVTLTPILFSYTSVSIAKVFFMTAAAFGGCALVGYTTKMNLQPLGTFFLFALIGLIIAMVTNMFLQSGPMDYLISVAAILLFAGLTAYDMQMLKRMYREGHGSGGLVVFGALALYLDFLNMFIHLLRLFGQAKD